MGLTWPAPVLNMALLLFQFQIQVRMAWHYLVDLDNGHEFLFLFPGGGQ